METPHIILGIPLKLLSNETNCFIFIFVTISGEGLEGKKVLSDGKHWLPG